MGSLKLTTASSGSVILSPENTASDVTVTIPATTATMVTTAATQTLTNKTLTSPTITGASMSSMASSVITSGTSVTASGTSVDFTGIPSWVKRITVMLSGVSTNSTSPVLIRLGTSSGFVTSGYSSTATTSGTKGSSSAGLTLESQCNTAYLRQGAFTLSHLGSNKWVMAGGYGDSVDNNWSFSGGGISLADTLTQVRITPTNGTDTFDAGTINILYE